MGMDGTRLRHGCRGTDAPANLSHFAHFFHARTTADAGNKHALHIRYDARTNISARIISSAAAGRVRV